MMTRIIFTGMVVLILAIGACKPDDPSTPFDPTDRDLTHIPYNPQPYELSYSGNFPPPVIPADNPLTKEGVELGRHLFYDPIMSLDSTISCSSCHRQEFSFAANVPFSLGVNGKMGSRNSMALVNLLWNNNGFNWDGSGSTLELQHLMPVEDPVEMAEDWNRVETKLRRSTFYPEMYREAFGITHSSQVDRNMTSKALAQFIRTIISDSTRYDVLSGYHGPPPFPTEQEVRAMEVYFFETGALLGDAECIHCHTAGMNDRLFTNNLYMNNGLDSVDHVSEFADPGRGGVTGKLGEMGAFRVPTLRNISRTAPYMHDGRFWTLREVVEHYNFHLKPSPTIDNILAPNIGIGLGLTEQNLDDLVYFLEVMLTDYRLLNNQAFKNPFEE